MGAQPSSPKGHGALGGVGGILNSPNTKQAAPFAAADSHREARPPRKCLPLAWSAGADDDEIDQPQLSPGNAFREAAKEAWEPRPISRSSTASTATGNNSSYRLHRPGSASSGTTLPSMSSSASLGYHSYRSPSSCSRPSPGTTPLAREKHRRERRSTSKAMYEQPSPEPAAPAAQAAEEEAGTEVRLEDARARAAKSMEDLMLKLNASRSSRNSGAASSSDHPGQRSQASSSSSSAAPAQSFTHSRRSSLQGPEAGSQSRQAWAEPKRSSDHLELRMPIHDNSGGSADRSLRAAGNAGPSMPSVPSADPSPSMKSKAAHQVRTLAPSQPMERPAANVLGHRYLDPSDGV